jgi:transcriptional regulator with GAF, ATPase, and Fis domain
MSTDLIGHKSIFDLMGHSLAIHRLSQQIEQVARTNLTVLIQGETGTGKELVACFIHQQSNRARKPCVAIDCGVLPESLFESESFGHVKGAFTGACSRRIGYFELASGGTLFLDEIANLPLSIQRKLLRSVQERSIYPVGSARAIAVDVRLITASSIMLTTQVEAGCFRSDLFYRLCEFIIYVPPLRERQEDILFLAERFRAEANAELDKDVKRFSPKAQAYLLAQAWPGNVRELRNTIRRAVLLSTGMITPKHLCQPSGRVRVGRVPSLAQSAPQWSVGPWGGGSVARG